MQATIDDKATARLQHIEKLLQHGFQVDETVESIQKGQGNVAFCLDWLASHAAASAMRAWFRQRDLAGTRHWFRQAAMLDRKHHERQSDTSGPLGKMLQLMRPLVANDEGLIDWFARFDASYDTKRVEDHRTVDFQAYQAVLALRGEWRLLEARCEKVLADPPRASVLQKYQVDHLFYLNLAREDETGMLDALGQLLQPRALAARSNDESGLTEDLISTPAVIFTKLAWRRGLRIVPQSPLVPAEWLPIETPPPFVSAYGLA